MRPPRGGRPTLFDEAMSAVLCRKAMGARKGLCICRRTREIELKTPVIADATLPGSERATQRRRLCFSYRTSAEVVSPARHSQAAAEGRTLFSRICLTRRAGPGYEAPVYAVSSEGSVCRYRASIHIVLEPDRRRVWPCSHITARIVERFAGAPPSRCRELCADIAAENTSSSHAGASQHAAARIRSGTSLSCSNMANQRAGWR